MRLVPKIILFVIFILHVFADSININNLNYNSVNYNIEKLIKIDIKHDNEFKL